MVHDQEFVARQPHIDLHAIGADVARGFDGGDGVFWCARVVAAVGKDGRHATNSVSRDQFGPEIPKNTLNLGVELSKIGLPPVAALETIFRDISLI